MKKLNFLLVFVAMLFFACNDSDSVNTEKKEVSKETASENTEKETVSDEVVESGVKAGTEIAYVKGAKLYFYYPESSETKQLEAEPDSVFTCVFNKDEDIIYYTVVRDGILWLREARHQNDNTMELKDLCNFNVKKDDCLSETYGEPSLLLFTENKEVVLQYGYEWGYFGFTKALFLSTTTENAELQEKEADYYLDLKFLGFEYYDKDFPHKVKNNCLIYEGKNLSNDLNLEPDEGEIEFFEFKFSKDKSKLMFAALLGMGDLAHGPFCIANIDGTNQKIIMEDGVSSALRPYWYGNQAVFIRDIVEGSNDNASELSITNADDNSISAIEKEVDYFTVRVL